MIVSCLFNDYFRVSRFNVTYTDTTASFPYTYISNEYQGANPGTYTGTPTNPATAGFATNGTPTSPATIEVIIGNGGTISQINVTSAGSGYAVDNTITLDRAVTGIGGIADPVITLVAENFYANSTYGSTNFDLDNTDQTELILNILTYSGVVIRDPQIVQTAQQLVMQEEANQKS